MEKIWEKKGAFCCFVDFEKTFDTMPRIKLWSRMEELDVPIHYSVAVYILYEHVKAKIKTQEGLSECFGSDRC